MPVPNPRLCAWLSLLLGVYACSDSGDGNRSGDGGMDGGDGRGGGSGGTDKFGNAGNGKGPVDAGFVLEDHFFINDDAPPVCLADGGMRAGPDAGGTLECPDDKNRQGCPCEVADAQEPCWPGRRENRHHGQCHDGTTTCIETEEFGKRWGRCEGYQLPEEGALRGPEACGCFSSGKWDLNNLSPCQVPGNGGEWFLYSSLPDLVDGKLQCPNVAALPPSAPASKWSDSALTMDCGGQFRLCYTIKAGFASAPRPDDCIITEQCVDVWYDTPGERMELPPMPGWASDDGACGAKFVDTSGYGEMTLEGVSRECDEVDNGDGEALVFFTATYCPAACQDTPDTDDCKACSQGGSGDF